VTSRESAAPQISHAHDHVNDHSRAKARPTATPRVLGANQRAAHDSCANLTSAAQSHPSDSSGPLSSSSPGSRHTRHATPRARASSLDAARRPSRVDDVDGDDDGDARARSAYFRDIDPNPNVTSVRAFALASPAFVEPSFARVFARLARVSRVSRVSRVIRVAPRRRWTTRGDANDAGRREVARVVRARPSGVTARAAIAPSSRGGETSRDARAADPPTRDGGATSHGGARARRPARRARDATGTRRTTRDAPMPVACEIAVGVDDAFALELARATLATNAVTFDARDDARASSRDDGERWIAEKVRALMTIARCASAGGAREHRGATIEDATRALRAADEAFARTREGVDPGDATLDARASPGRDTAAYALAMRALADAIAGSAIGEDGRRAAEIALETLKLEATRALSGLAGAASTTNAARDDACDEMFLWATQRGAMFKFVANVSEGGMREARASAAVDAGDAAARVPWDALLGVEQAVLSSSAPICEVLKQLTAMGDQIIMTIWLAAAMSGQDSRLYEAWAPTLRALPRAPCTALAWDVDTMRLVMDHDQVERLIDYQRKVRVQYDALFPALCEQVPEAFPASVFGDYSRFALAYDIWTSYAMKVQDPQTLQIYEVIVPGVFLCNHALYAHSVRYTSLERGTRAFRLELARGARPGDAITISYGRLDNADLMAYYGFTLPSNPYDRVVLSSLASQANEEQTAALARASEMCGVDLTELPACIALDGSLDRVLTQMRIMSAPQRFMEWCERIDGYHPYTVVDGELEYKVLCELRSHLCHLVAERQATEGSLSHRLSTVHHESTHSVANATRWYLSGQIRIMQSALARVDVLLASYGSGKRSRDEIE